MRQARHPQRPHRERRDGRRGRGHRGRRRRRQATSRRPTSPTRCCAASTTAAGSPPRRAKAVSLAPGAAALRLTGAGRAQSRPADSARADRAQPTRIGISISVGVSEPCRPTRRGLVGEVAARHDRGVVAAGHHDVAQARQHARRRPAPNQPRADRLVAGQHGRPGPPAPRARWRPRRRPAPPAAVEVPEPRLATEQRHAVAQPVDLVDVDAALRGLSTMPWSATTSSRVEAGSASRSCSASASTIASCWSHWVEATPYRCPVQSRSPS